MAAKRKKRSSGKTFRFQLSLGGVVSIAVVSFCLFLWMFLLGVWAGQTILLPAARPVVSDKSGKGKEAPRHLVSEVKNRQVGTAAQK
ncbi:MAG: hypothetical protein C4563_04675 [Desulfobulbus sp.]|jgi:hypothetical protein|nr:MAG: hypothetical protein C4563_04675 [Desulfobulbus sp.]